MESKALKNKSRVYHFTAGKALKLKTDQPCCIEVIMPTGRGKRGELHVTPIPEPLPVCVTVDRGEKPQPPPAAT